MEKKEIQEWRDRLIKMFGIYHSDGQEYITCPLCGINLDELAKHMIEELDKAREEGRMSAMNELKRAFSKVFYKSGELWFDYLFEDGDTEAEEDAKAVVEGYWEDILSELKDNKRYEITTRRL